MLTFISGNMIENMIVTCGTKAEVTSWLEALKNHVIPTPSTTSSKPVSLQVVNNSLYAGCPSFRGINLSTFQSINLVIIYSYSMDKNI